MSSDRVLPDFLPEPPKGRTVVLAIGKAASAMAEVAVSHWRGACSGLVITRHGHALEAVSQRYGIEQIEAGHPIPDENSVAGARRALAFVQGLGPDDLVLVLLSGGGSSLCCLPIEGVTLAEKQRVTSALLAAGASVQELNTVRTCLSRIKGGRLAEAAAPARVDTLIVSDVTGNDPAVIASGPTIPRMATIDDLKNIVARYHLDLPAYMIESAERNIAPRTLSRRQSLHCRIIATPADAVEAAARIARNSGYDVRMLGDAIEGEARRVAVEHANFAKEVARSGRPTIILSGGEVTVRVENSSGVGGPNTEFLLALAIELDGAKGIHALACDTDGCDGIGDNAGAIIGPHTLSSARENNIDPVERLNANDSYRFFQALGDLVITGPTQVNVSDFRAILVDGRGN